MKNNATVNQSLSYIVDLREVLPKWVTFEFSTTIGYLDSVSHAICSWYFSSSLEIDNKNTNPKGPNRNISMLAMGFIAYGFILVSGLAMVLFA